MPNVGDEGALFFGEFVWRLERRQPIGAGLRRSKPDVPPIFFLSEGEIPIRRVFGKRDDSSRTRLFGH